MAPLWLLRGEFEAPGWKALRQDFEDEKIDILHLDPNVWALVDQEEAPSGYEDLTVTEPQDGLYLDPQGNPVFVAERRIVDGPEEVIERLGGRATRLLDEVKDPFRVLELLGRAF